QPALLQEDFMSGSERRNSSRKLCTMPVRFRVNGNGNSEQAEKLETAQGSEMRTAATGRSEFVGKALNLSERGVYFTCREKLSIGQPIEMYFTLPSELTGRAPENVRCSARVVHVDEDGQAGLRGIGASVEQFEPVAAVRNWAN
ncbi:MAG: PilZ domain-containing protein, partial [Candidatus Acidiferrales bacterium]